jgi:hypothetical protein
VSYARAERVPDSVKAEVPCTCWTCNELSVSRAVGAAAA